MTIAYLALGSNLGARKRKIKSAIKELSLHMRIVQESSIIETPPAYECDQPVFLNAVVKVETTLSPRDLLKLAHTIEKQQGRISAKRFGPRALDIDILYYGRHIIHEGDLIIPHIGINERDFVLIPMCEISPKFVCPTTKMTVSRILDNLLTKVA